MKKFKIATWNINSLRVRLPHVLAWLATTQPDILALQELKLPTEDFPYAAIREAGYTAIVNGQKTYNGVAILTRQENFSDVIVEVPQLVDHQRRIVAVTLNDIRILNLYVPNGESITSEKYQYKLKWLAHLKLFLQEELLRYPKLIMLGDFNIAPEDQDTYDPAACAGHVLCSEPEREMFRELLQLGLQDCFRLSAQAEKSFTWWDYRLNAFKRNMGLRIDHVLTSHLLAPACVQCYIDKAPRGWERPSDHAPVVTEFIQA